MGNAFWFLLPFSPTSESPLLPHSACLFTGFISLSMQSLGFIHTVAYAGAAFPLRLRLCVSTLRTDPLMAWKLLPPPDYTEHRSYTNISTPAFGWFLLEFSCAYPWKRNYYFIGLIPLSVTKWLYNVMSKISFLHILTKTLKKKNHNTRSGYVGRFGGREGGNDTVIVISFFNFKEKYIEYPS